jgi:hypothetical protein
VHDPPPKDESDGQWVTIVDHCAAPRSADLRLFFSRTVRTASTLRRTRRSSGIGRHRS